MKENMKGVMYTTNKINEEIKGSELYAITDANLSRELFLIGGGIK